MGSARLVQKKKSRSRLRTIFSIVCVFSLTAVSLGYSSLPLLGHWLVREDPIREADAIAVLTGRFPMRALEAAELYKRGYAREVWLTHPEGTSSSKEFGDEVKPGEDLLNFQLLHAAGVPVEAIHILEIPIVNTADELNAIDSGLKERGDDSVIIVTSKAHTRRVYELWNKYHAAVGRALVHAVSDDEFIPSRWWKTASTRAQGIHEVLGMINVWAGMPVHPPIANRPAMAVDDGPREYDTTPAGPTEQPASQSAD